MYPWEKPPQKPEAEAQAPSTAGTELEEDFPWSARSAIQEPPAELEEPEFSEREEQLVQSMLASARKQARIGELEYVSLDYTNEETETDWRPLVGVALAALCLGSLGFWLTRPQPQTVTRVPVPAATDKTRPQNPPPAVEEPVALQDATIQPTDTRTVVARALREGGRSNPFLSELPPPIAPTPPAPEPKAPSAPPPPPPPEPSLNLVSIATSGSNRIALVQVSGSGTPYLQEVSEGDRVVGWQVKSITSEKVVLSKGKQNQTLSAQ